MLKKIRVNKIPRKDGEVLIVFDGLKQYNLRRVGRHCYVTSNRCPHAGARLDQAELLTYNGACAIRCPRHGWIFDLKTGFAPHHPLFKLATFRLKKDEEGFYFEVEEENDDA